MAFVFEEVTNLKDPHGIPAMSNERLAKNKLFQADNAK
jgi:hypothetical protein